MRVSLFILFILTSFVTAKPGPMQKMEAPLILGSWISGVNGGRGIYYVEIFKDVNGDIRANWSDSEGNLDYSGFFSWNEEKKVWVEEYVPPGRGCSSWLWAGKESFEYQGWWLKRE
jgi:hypothetical protein